MLEREQEWRQFRNLITNSEMSPAEIADNTRLPIRVVTGFHDQLNAQKAIALSNTIPERLRRYAVGFRYVRLSRWMATYAETKARADYDAGVTDVATGKFKVKGDDAYVLFSIPRRIVAKGRRPYFSAQVYP